MFRRPALRASRAAYMATAGAVGTVVVEASHTEDHDVPEDAARVAEASQTVDSETSPDSVAIAVEPVKTVFPDLPEKLSVYPSPARILVLLDSPSPLELRIGQVRREVCGYYSGARTQVQGVIDRWIQVEEAVESRLKSFHDPAERLNPGLLYTGISALTASVVVRSRSLPVRILLPPLSFIGAFAYFLPRTAGRVGSWVEELEGKYVPRVGEIRRTSVAHTGMAVGMLGDKYRQGREGLGKGARGLVEQLESSTGLKLGAAFGWTSAGDDKKSESDSSDENKNT